MAPCRRMLACLLGLAITVDDCRSQDARHDTSDHSSSASSTVAAVSQSLEELWATETDAAQKELQRFLHGYYRNDVFSMPIHTPNYNPIPYPHHAPSHVPVTAAPTAKALDPEQPSASPEAAATFAPQTGLPTPLNGGCLKGRTPEQYLLDKLLEVTTVNLLLDPALPQGMAFNFILGDPTVRNDVCGYSTLQQRYGLATLYFATKGDQWFQKVQWMTTARECDWHGVACNDGARATGLDLSSNNLVGTLPDELSTLYAVGGLQFFSNNITGPIPEGLANLTSIELLDLEQNQMNGPGFPTAIMTLPKLKQLFLSNNALSGSIPGDIGLRLTGLTDFWAANNGFVGPLPSSIGELTKLRTLILYGNNMDSSLPPSIGKLRDLTNLQLYRNIFDQQIPSDLFDLTSLTSLRLDHNFLTGKIPTKIGKLALLTDLRIHNNFFESRMPEDFFNLNRLRVFTAGTNLFTGNMPNIFVGFQQLQDLDLSTSFFSGPIPDTIFDNPSIERVYLNNNALTGNVPANYANSPALVDLYLDSNLLTGEIPRATSLPQLKELLLHNNMFSGEMPLTVCSLRTAGSLDNLFSDCGGAEPEIDCSFPDCCNRCFEGGKVTDQRRELEQIMSERRETHRRKQLENTGSLFHKTSEREDVHDGSP